LRQSVRGEWEELFAEDLATPARADIFVQRAPRPMNDRLSKLFVADMVDAICELAV